VASNTTLGSQNTSQELILTERVAIGSLFGYPPICHAIGISAKRALAFPVRSLTLALATPAAKNLAGDANTASALAIMSGILGALVGSQLLDRLRIPDGEWDFC
jgi:putative effector of murein hydrolase